MVGTPYEPGLTGQLKLLEGGEITLNERRYEAERGVITFVDERRIVPVVRSAAEHDGRQLRHHHRRDRRRRARPRRR